MVNTDAAPSAPKTVLAGANPTQPLVPQVSTLAIDPAFNYEAPANSLTVIRVKSQMTQKETRR